MNHIEFHQSTLDFINFATAENIIIFSETEAWEIASRFHIPHMKVVWGELKEHGLIRTYKGRYTWNINELYRLLGNPENTSN